MGAGFHGKNGIKQSLKADMWRKYIIPRLIYGLDVLNLRTKDIHSLESFQIRNSTQLQGLPTNVSNTIVLALFGLLSVKACIDKNVLTLFCNAIRDRQCIEYEIAIRQLAVKDFSDSSWFSNVRNVLDLHPHPSAYELIENRPSKQQWKQMITSNVYQTTESHWRQETKSPLKYLNLE